MIKLTVLIAGLTFSIFCGLMTFRSRGNTNNNTFLRNNKDGNRINDIKEIFGLPPLSLGSASSLQSGGASTSGGYSSSSGVGGYGGGGAYLPPKTLRTALNSQDSAQNNSTSKPESTTALFRIFIASTKPPLNASTVPSTTSKTSPSTSSTTTTTTEAALTEEALSEMEEATTLPSQSNQDEDHINIGFHAEFDVMNFDIMGRGEIAKNISNNETSPPQMNPKIPIPVTTLQPPSMDAEMTTLPPPPSNLTENIVNTENNNGNGSFPDGSQESSDLTTPPTNLYLPPNKEYLPPKQY